MNYAILLADKNIELDVKNFYGEGSEAYKAVQEDINKFNEYRQRKDKELDEKELQQISKKGKKKPVLNEESKLKRKAKAQSVTEKESITKANKMKNTFESSDAPTSFLKQSSAPSPTLTEKDNNSQEQSNSLRNIVEKKESIKIIISGSTTKFLIPSLTPTVKKDEPNRGPGI